MSFRGVNLHGEVRLFGDDALRAQFNRAAQRRIKDSTSRKQVVRRLLSHPILSFDKWSLAEERENHHRASLCRKRGERLRDGLTKNDVTFLGLDGSTGSPNLTAAKLTGHSVKYLDIDTERMLLSIERHPMRGKGPIRVQYWLSDEGAKTLRLLNEREDVEDPILTGPMNVLRNGKWQPIDVASEENFWQQVETLFGPSVRQTIAKSFSPQEVGLISYLALPDGVNEQLKRLTGVDVRQREEEAHRKREAEYLAKYGPQQSSAPPGIYLSPGSIRLGIKREDPPTQS